MPHCCSNSEIYIILLLSASAKTSAMYIIICIWRTNRNKTQRSMWIADKTTDSSRSHSHKQLPIAEGSASFITHCSLCVCVCCIEIVWSFCNITHTHTSSQLWPSIMSVLHCSDCLNRITGSNENWTAVADVYVAAFTTLLSKIQAFLTVCVCVYVCLCGVANGHGNTTHTHKHKLGAVSSMTGVAEVNMTWNGFSLALSSLFKL